jgi:hypothetical protein
MKFIESSELSEDVARLDTLNNEDDENYDENEDDNE